VDRLALVVPFASEDADDLPSVEVYTRLVRDLEEYCAIPPGRRLPLRVAVFFLQAHDWPAEKNPRKASEIAVRHAAPALYALLRRTLRARRLRFFSGQLPAGPDLAASAWVGEGLAWLLQ
jgi:hypothetical protein